MKLSFLCISQAQELNALFSSYADASYRQLHKINRLWMMQQKTCCQKGNMTEKYQGSCFFLKGMVWEKQFEVNFSSSTHQ